MSLDSNSQKLVTLLGGIQNSSSQKVFAQVLGYGSNEFGGYPAATVTVAPGESEFRTTGKNRRGYEFVISIYVLDDKPSGRAANWQTMRQLQDAVMDAVDQSSTLDGLVYPATPDEADPVVTAAGRAIVALVRVPIKELVRRR